MSPILESEKEPSATCAHSNSEVVARGGRPPLATTSESASSSSLKRDAPHDARLDIRRLVRRNLQLRSSSVVAPLLLEPPTIGHKQLHPTHLLHHKSGIVICLKCGFYSVSKVDQLARPCVAPNINGKQRIARWAKGLTPRHGLDWPQTFSDLQEGLIWKPP